MLLLVINTLTFASPSNITDLAVIIGNTTSCPLGFERIQQVGNSNGDFNQGAKASPSGLTFIYLCAERKVGKPAIARLEVVASDDASERGCPGSTFGDAQRIKQMDGSDGDFNQGAGGKFIYVCYSFSGSTRLTDIVVSDPDCDIPGVPSSHKRITQEGSSDGDFNQGAGGDHITLCATYE